MVQTKSSSPGVCTCRTMSAETMKRPEPITAPATKAVAPRRDIALTNSGFAVTSPLAPLALGVSRAHAPAEERRHQRDTHHDQAGDDVRRVPGREERHPDLHGVDHEVRHDTGQETEVQERQAEQHAPD